MPAIAEHCIATIYAKMNEDDSYIRDIAIKLNLPTHLFK